MALDLITIFIFWPVQYLGFYITAGIYAVLVGVGTHYLLSPSHHELLRMVRKQTEGREPGDNDLGFDITRRRVLALTLLVIGVLSVAPLAQVYAAMVQAGVYIPSQGGSNLVQCSDLTNLGCWAGGNSGAVSATNSTLCTSGNNLCAQPGQTVTLGTWQNMPSASTELFGNTTNRNILRVVTDAGYYPTLRVNCVKPSNTLGAKLQLQYANFSVVTNTNNSNFVNAGVASIKIDNSLNSPCPGTLSYGVTSFRLPILPVGVRNTAFIFRVIGSGGGGNGDNPRLSGLSVIISSQLTNGYTVFASAITTTGLNVVTYSQFPDTSSFTSSFSWIATNSTVDTTTVQAATGTCVWAFPAITSCTVAVTFPLAYAATPVVVAAETDNGTLAQILTVFAGELTLFSTQSVTV